MKFSFKMLYPVQTSRERCASNNILCDNETLVESILNCISQGCGLVTVVALHLESAKKKQSLNLSVLGGGGIVPERKIKFELVGCTCKRRKQGLV